MLDKAIRELDRERIGLQNQDKKLIMEIKKMAKANQMVPPAAPILLTHHVLHVNCTGFATMHLGMLL